MKELPTRQPRLLVRPSSIYVLQCMVAEPPFALSLPLSLSKPLSVARSCCCCAGPGDGSMDMHGRDCYCVQAGVAVVRGGMPCQALRATTHTHTHNNKLTHISFVGGTA